MGIGELDAVLPDAGLPRGTVVELAVAGGSSMATSIALGACRSAQQEARLHGGEAAWCAFVDPSGSLYAPGVARAGVELSRLLVVRPPVEALARVALKLAEARAFSVVVVDTVGVPGASPDVSLGSWPRVVRRLSHALEGTATSLMLITDLAARRPLALPVGMRLELSRPSPEQLQVRIAKERRGRISGPRAVAWARPHSGAVHVA